MTTRLLCALVAWTVVLLQARADETIATLKVGDKEYHNITVTRVTATDIIFESADGIGNAKLKDLDPDLQKHFHYDAAKAAEQLAKQKDQDTRYHDALLHQPAPKPPTADTSVADTHGEPVWGTSIPDALRQAKAEHKNVLLDFTGSDWCPWCIKFDSDVLKQQAFWDYANKNLVLVRLDFPRHTELAPDLKAANEAAGKRFNVDGFPTYILLSPDARELGRQVGYLEGGPAAFNAELDSYARR